MLATQLSKVLLTPVPAIYLEYMLKEDDISDYEDDRRDDSHGL